MLNIRYINLLFIFLICFSTSNAQTSRKFDLSYEELENKLNNFPGDPKNAWELIHYYIQKSKRDNNSKSLVYAYRYASVYSPFPQNIHYADSAIAIANKTRSKTLMSEAYINRGSRYSKQSFYEKSLDDILLANKYSTEIKDEYNTNKTIYLIAQNKIYLGEYEEADKELDICLNYFKNNLNNKDTFGKSYEMYYLYSLMSKIDINVKLRKFNENDALAQEGLNYVTKNNIKIYIPYFISYQGTNAYYKKEYSFAIKKLNDALKLYDDRFTHITERYYLGLSNWKIGKHSLAIKHFKEIDKEYNKTNKLDPQFRPVYEYLIKYNDSIRNKDKQLEYINKLMILDKSYEKSYKYIYPKINKEYDTQKLLNEKNRIEKSFTFQKRLLIYGIIIIFLFGFYFVYKYYKLKKTYRKRFNEIISERPEIQSQEIDTSSLLQQPTLLEIPSVQKTEFDYEFYNKISGLNPNFVKNILDQLDGFEKENGYLNNQISQKSMSEKLGTNSTYFSKIINTYKGKNFNIYIHDLRLDYIINHLKTDIMYLNMDVKELSSIAGFSNPENFSDHFNRKFGMKPSIFIKMMKEQL